MAMAMAMVIVWNTILSFENRNSLVTTRRELCMKQDADKSLLCTIYLLLQHLPSTHTQPMMIDRKVFVVIWCSSIRSHCMFLPLDIYLMLFCSTSSSSLSHFKLHLEAMRAALNLFPIRIRTIGHRYSTRKLTTNRTMFWQTRHIGKKKWIYESTSSTIKVRNPTERWRWRGEHKLPIHVYLVRCCSCTSSLIFISCEIKITSQMVVGMSRIDDT